LRLAGNYRRADVLYIKESALPLKIINNFYHYTTKTAFLRRCQEAEKPVPPCVSTIGLLTTINKKEKMPLHKRNNCITTPTRDN
jgi:hypothetical protein